MGTIAKVTAGGATHLVASTCYGTCNTAKDVVAKVATIQDSQAFTLITGITVHIKFTYHNTATNPTLNVNNTGAKSIYKYGTTAPGTDANTSWQAGSVKSFTYDGTYWQMNDSIKDLSGDDIPYTAGSTDTINSVITDTQLALDDVAGDVSEIDSRTSYSNTTLSIGTYGNSILLAKQGKIATFQVRPFTSLPAGGYTTLGTLTPGYTPLYIMYEDFIDQSGRHLRLYANPTDRQLKIYNYGSAITADNNTYHNFSIFLA